MGDERAGRMPGHRRMRRWLALACACAAASLTAISPASAQSAEGYPQKPVRVYRAAWAT